MKESPERLALRLEIEAEKVVDFFCRLLPDSWQQKVDTEAGGWDARQLLAHLFHRRLPSVS
jgi:hypothetical protein